MSEPREVDLTPEQAHTLRLCMGRVEAAHKELAAATEMQRIALAMLGVTPQQRPAIQGDKLLVAVDEGVPPQE